MAKAISQLEREAMREPIYWFAVLEHSRERGDLQRAADAIRQLRLMGIEVKDRRKGVRRGK